MTARSRSSLALQREPEPSVRWCIAPNFGKPGVREPGNEKVRKGGQADTGNQFMDLGD
jgi:hypothetical protein